MTDDQHARGDAPAATLPSTLQSRYDQMFPELAPQEIERLRRFGSIRRYADGERLSRTGEVGRSMFVIISGHVAITQRDGLGHITPIVDQGPGRFMAEVGTLSGRAALVDGHAEGDVEALTITPENLRRLLVAEAELGERIVRALILRRVGLIESHASGPVLIGSPTSSDFALDSIPAVLAITRDPYIVYTSNIFALLGLRALYFVLADVVQRFRYLRTGLAVILCFVAGKMLLAGTIDVSVTVSLGVIVLIVLVALAASWAFPRQEQAAR